MTEAYHSPGGDIWSEIGEHGRWVRIHVVPGLCSFLPWKAAKGPGRKTSLTPTRSTQGIDSNGYKFKTHDDWTMSPGEAASRLPWTGRTIFTVDNILSDRKGTDQRRQISEACSFFESRGLAWADMIDSGEE